MKRSLSRRCGPLVDGRGNARVQRATVFILQVRESVEVEHGGQACRAVIPTKLYTGTRGKHLGAVCHCKSELPEPTQSLKGQTLQEAV